MEAYEKEVDAFGDWIEDVFLDAMESIGEHETVVYGEGYSVIIKREKESN